MGRGCRWSLPAWCQSGARAVPSSALFYPYADAGSGDPVESCTDRGYFFKSHFLDGLSDQAIDVLHGCDGEGAHRESLIVIRTLGGAIDQVGDDESAYPHRGARYNLSIDAGWSDPALNAAAIGRARSLWEAMRPFANGWVYVNFAELGDKADRRAVFGRGSERLEGIQRAYDPDGLFAAAAGRP